MIFSQNKIKINFFFFFLIFFLSYVSYANNFFKVTSNNWYLEHQIDSEQLVLDGLLYGFDKNKNLKLGSYSRNTHDIKDYLKAREYYLNKNKNGEFQKYESSFGLQVKLFYKLFVKGIDNLSLYHSIVSSLMALVVAFMTLSIKRDFSLIVAIVFSSVFILSPWIVIFARNLFWLPFTWFLPIAISMHYSTSIFKNTKVFYVMISLIFFSFLLKFLCGYEFITSIYFATCVPIIFNGIKQNIKNIKIFKNCLILFLIFLSAFIFSIIVHTKNTTTLDNNSQINIFSIAERRLWSNNSFLIDEKKCANDTKCVELAKSLKANPVTVVSKYFLVVDFIPWFYSDQISKKDKNMLKQNLKILNSELNFENIKIFYREIFKNISNELIFFIFIKLLSLLGFFVFLIYSLLAFMYSNKAYKSLTIFSFIAPLSWFILAKGHSAIHLHINFVLWYITFVPSSLIEFLFLLIF